MSNSKNNNRVLKIKTLSDEDSKNKFHSIDVESAKKSGFLKHLIEMHPDQLEIEIPKEGRIRGIYVDLVFEWLNNHKDKEPKISPTPLSNYNISEIIGPWEYDFFNKKVYDNNYDNLFEFYNVAYYLQISALIDQTASFIASLVKDLSSEEFQNLLKIEKDCEPEDLILLEEEIRRDFEKKKEKENKTIDDEKKANERSEQINN